MLIEIVVLLIGAFLYWIVRDKAKYEGYPPGPFRFPLIGNLPQLAFKSRLPSTALRQLSENYGDIMYVRMGNLDFVLFSSYSSIVEFFNVMEGPCPYRKIYNYIEDRSLGGNMGLITSNGPTWQNLRRFSIRTLREYGFGKSSSMDNVINEEVAKFVRHFKKQLENCGDGVIQINPDLFDAAVLNVLWRLVTGKAYELDDQRVIKMLELSDAYVRSVKVDDISICFPALREWFPNWTGKNLQMECVKNLKNFLAEVVKEHTDTDYINDPQCFIDVFLQMIEKDKDKNEETDFNHNQLLYTLLDLFQAGSETTSKTLTFALIYMIINPEKQERVHEEIQSVLKLEDNRNITGDMKLKLPYTSAVILETLRIIDVVPIPAPYECHADSVLRGYRIPKGTAIMLNIEAVHYQKSIWGDPENYRPERFISKVNGELEPKLLEFVMPFGKGKRLCLGHVLAETTLFLYFTVIMRNFKFEKVLNDISPSTEPKPGLTYSPRPFTARVVVR